MKLNITFENELPKPLAEGLGITEESAFEAFYQDGILYVHLLTEDEEKECGLYCPVTSALCDGDCEVCAVLDAACTGECLGCDFHSVCAEGRKAQ